MIEVGEDGLTDAQRTFCEVYIHNGFQLVPAYRVAFPKSKDSTKRPGYPYELIKKPAIQEYIKRRREEEYASLMIDDIRITEELYQIAFADKDDEIFTTSFKLKALEMLQKQMGLLKPKEEIDEDIEVDLED